jgi:hypothetical protein
MPPRPSRLPTKPTPFGSNPRERFVLGLVMAANDGDAARVGQIVAAANKRRIAAAIQGRPCWQWTILTNLVGDYAKGESDDQLKLLLDAKVPADVPDSKDKILPLERAVNNGALNAARLILDHGGSANVRGAMSRPLLHLALPHRGMVNVLLEAEAYPDPVEHGGVTPLMRAAKANDRPVIRALIAAKADPNAVDDNGHSVLDYGADAKEGRPVPLLRKLGAQGTAETLELKSMRRIARESPEGRKMLEELQAKTRDRERGGRPNRKVRALFAAALRRA